MSPSSELADYKTSFIQTCLSVQALKFGTFTLKSGRQSPYFFNAGLFHRNDLARSMATAFAHTLASSDIQFDVLFGPAYKGITLAALASDKLLDVDAKKYSGVVSYSYNRKEAKAHGEGGSIVGSPLKGKQVVIVDDVITAGTAIREAIGIIKAEGGTLAGIIVAFNRLEKTPAKEGECVDVPRQSAIGEVRKEYGIPVLSILSLDDVVGFLREGGSEEDLKRLEEYRQKYKASD